MHQPKRPTPGDIWDTLGEIRDEFYPTLSLGNVEVKISNRLKIAGKVEMKRLGWPDQHFVVVISGPYHDEFGWIIELYETLKHEIIHIRYPRIMHDSFFKSELHRIGAERYCKSRGETIRKLIYRCKACGHTFHGMDNINFCPKCEDLVESIGVVEE